MNTEHMAYMKVLMSNNIYISGKGTS